MQKPSFTRRALVTALAGFALTASLGVLAQGFQVHYRVAGIVPASEPVPETSFTSHTFTNCGHNGRSGPSLGQCSSAYAGQIILEPEIQYSVSSGYQRMIVPISGTYRIKAIGASGGTARNSSFVGLGAVMQGDFQLAKGDSLLILVGQEGGSNASGNSGGGGGSFVAKGTSPQNSIPLLVAGGGAGVETTATNYPEMHGWIHNNGQIGGGPSAYKNAFGQNGGGGRYSGSSNSGGGGGGFYGNGTSSKQFDPASQFNGGEGGKSFVNGGLGGRSYFNNIHGGFGGGAGPYGAGGGAGGGGGYSGGENGNNVNNHTGGGGGSYNAGTNQSNQSGANSGHGRVTITLLSQ